MIRTALLLSGLLLTQIATAAEWKVLEPDSRIGFVATYDSIPFQAWFKSYDATIRFSPDKLDESSFDVRIRTASVDSDSPDRDDGMRQREWLAVDKYPEARYHAERFEKITDNHYTAIGKLTVKGISRDVAVNFEWQPQPGGKAWMNAQARLKRGDFNIGTGEWARDETIGFDIAVNASLELASASQ